MPPPSNPYCPVPVSASASSATEGNLNAAACEETSAHYAAAEQAISDFLSQSALLDEAPTPNSKPSDFVTLRLMTISNVVGRSIGKSAGVCASVSRIVGIVTQLNAREL